MQERTRPGGVHVLLPGGGGLAPEALLSYYPDGAWEPDQVGRTRRGGRRGAGLALTRLPDADMEADAAER
jgi:hypothetical protein